MDKNYIPTRVNGVWRVYDTKGGGYVAHVKSATKSGALNQMNSLHIGSNP